MWHPISGVTIQVILFRESIEKLRADRSRYTWHRGCVSCRRMSQQWLVSNRRRADDMSLSVSFVLPGASIDHFAIMLLVCMGVNCSVLWEISWHDRLDCTIGVQSPWVMERTPGLPGALGRRRTGGQFFPRYPEEEGGTKNPGDRALFPPRISGTLCHHLKPRSRGPPLL
ncbi:hypothetical protein BX600DRAFT_143947 [Xylariales sp. PMI_506]|nr:hypothetical protein BX600DRAFT_143947 [Xylariales sp. PMI_506]